MADSNWVEKSIVMNFTGFISHLLRACRKKIVSISFSCETKAPAIGVFRKESVASNRALFNGSWGDRFFLYSPI